MEQQQPILGPEGIEYREPKGSWPLLFNEKDRIRWAHLVQHLQTSMPLEKAEQKAFMAVYQAKYPLLVY
jgi:hypothetical protein